MVKHLAKRNRRLHKKLRSGDFVEMGFNIDVKAKFEWSDEVLDTFIDKIETFDLAFGGGINEQDMRGFIAPMERGSVTEEQRQDIINWLNELDCEVVAGELEDSWR